MSELSDHELTQIIREADIAKEQLQCLKPYFKLLRENIHAKWEALTLEDGQAAKLLKFQLRTVIALEEAMIGTINQGKQAAFKREQNK